MYRPLDIWKGTLILDEADFANTGETSELIHFLNARATGTPIGRQNPDRSSQCDAFESFGLTIITQRRHFDDNATESRTIPFYSDISEKQLPTLETEEMITNGMMLQDKLLFIRMSYWNKIEIQKAKWIDGVSDHRLNAALLPVMALAEFAPDLKQLVKKTVQVIERERRKLKAQSEDGLVVNALWERIQDGLFGEHNGLFYIGREQIIEKGPDNEEQIIVRPLTTSALGEILKRSSKTIRKIVTSLNISPDNAPERARIRHWNVRPIFFDPKRLEKRLREFVVDYEKSELFKRLNLPVPDVPNVPVSPSEAVLNTQPKTHVNNTPRERLSGTSGTCGTLTQENFTLVLGKLKKLCWNKPYATTEELEYSTKIPRTQLLLILRALERDGKIVEHFPGTWRPT